MTIHSNAQRFARDVRGQDLVEYTLLLAFLVLGSAALFISTSQTINRIWTVISSRLAT